MDDRTVERKQREGAQCVIDNAQTGCRECWRDGALMWSVNQQAIMFGMQPTAATGISAALGAFQAGRITGDPAGLPKHMREPVKRLAADGRAQ